MKKDKIITLVIGILIGAIVTAAIFLIFKPGNSRKGPDFSGFNKDGEKFNPEDGDFDPSNFKPGEGRSRRSKDSDSQDENSKVEEKKTEDSANEKQD